MHCYFVDNEVSLLSFKNPELFVEIQLVRAADRLPAACKRRQQLPIRQSRCGRLASVTGDVTAR